MRKRKSKSLKRNRTRNSITDPEDYLRRVRLGGIPIDKDLEIELEFRVTLKRWRLYRVR